MGLLPLQRRSAQPPLDFPVRLNLQSCQANGLVAWYPPLSTRTPLSVDVVRGIVETTTGAVSADLRGEMGAVRGYVSGARNGLTYGSSLPTGATPFSISAWLCRTDMTAANSIAVLFGGNNNNAPHLGMNTSNHWIFNIWNGASLAGTSTPSADVWYHIVGACDGANLKLYENGVLTAGPTAATINLGAVDGFIGGESSVGFFWRGLIGDVRIYNRDLQPDEIWQMYAPPTRWELYQSPQALTVRSSGSALIVGTTAWGHVTGVTETNVRTLAGNWTGTGTISGVGDAEKLTLSAAQVETSEVVNSGARTVSLKYNFYAAGATVLMEYRHGATEAACLVASWNTYSVPFSSLGFVQIRLTSTL